MGLFDFLRRGKNEEEPEGEGASPYEEYGEDIAEDDILGGDMPEVEGEPATPFEKKHAEVEEEIEAFQEEGEPKPEPAPEPPPPPVKTEAELREERRVAERIRIEEIRAGVKVREAEASERIAEAKARKERGRSRLAGRVTKAITRTATLGGKVRLSKATKHLYVPKARPELYTTTAMRGLTTPSFGKKDSMRELITPSYDKLRELTALGGKPRDLVGDSPLAQAVSRPLGAGTVSVGAGAQDMALERLRGITFPQGLTTNEKLAYAEIVRNNDIDTRSHIVSELMDLGVEKREAIRAVEKLVKTKVVKRGRSFEGEPTLVIVK